VSLRFVLTLHSHLPWVLNRERWPHGSDWICEAALDSYLPLVAMLEMLERERVMHPITLGITPILAAQFAHPAFRHELDYYFAHRLETIAEAADSLRLTGDTDLLALVPYWQRHVLRLRETWQRIDKDLIGAFRRHAEGGRLELISSGATHGFLPLLGRDESIRLQLLVGRAEHGRHFGELPRGCWVPECAYRPAGEWHPLPDAPHHDGPRVGIEDHLRHAGFQWFFADSHMVEAGEAFDPYSNLPRKRPATAGKRSPYRAYRVGNARRGRPIDVLVRDPVSTEQVWSRYGGYPGDPHYLEFHKIRQPGGLKLWRVTGSDVDLGAKRRYEPDEANASTVRHAQHFQELLDNISAGAGPDDGIIAAPFDTELFGHWWFEGIEFLQHLYERFGSGAAAVHALPAGQALAEAPAELALQLKSGSWGKDGDFSMWLNPETEWTWRRLWGIEERFWRAVPHVLSLGDARLILEQAARMLLLAQSSDWQFIISTGAAGDYATKRFNEHCAGLEALLPYLEMPSPDLAAGAELADRLHAVDDPFPELFGAIAAASDIPE
jgi:1,4-alpha-glucan branching enzyme